MRDLGSRDAGALRERVRGAVSRRRRRRGGGGTFRGSDFERWRTARRGGGGTRRRPAVVIEQRSEPPRGDRGAARPRNRTLAPRERSASGAHWSRDQRYPRGAVLGRDARPAYTARLDQ